MRERVNKRHVPLYIVGALLLLAGLWYLWTAHDRPAWTLPPGPCFAFAADGQSVIATRTDEIVILAYPALTPLRQQPLPGSSYVAVCSGDGRWVARETDTALEIWRVADGVLVTQITGLRGNVNTLEMNADGTVLIRTHTENNGPWERWQLANGQVQTKDDLPLKNAQIKTRLSSMTLSIDLGAPELRITQSTTQHLVSSLVGAPPFQSIRSGGVFSPDGTLLAVGIRTIKNIDLVIVWRVRDGQLVATLPDAGAPINDLVWSDDSSLLAAAQGDTEYSSGAGVRVWRIADATLVDHFTTAELMRHVAFSRDARVIAAQSRANDPIFFWHIQK